MKGILYIITNDINDKVYIGKTYTQLEVRFKRHIIDAFRFDNLNRSKFQSAIIKYGEKHFSIKALGTFESGILEKKEVEYIAKYNSYKNGYNSTIGGDGLPLIEYDERKIIDMYNNGMTINSIMHTLGLGSSRQISYILKNNGIDYSSHISKAIPVLQIKDGVIINRFSSKYNAYKWLVENQNSSLKRCHAYYYIKQSCEMGCKRFGYHWKYDKDH